MATRGTLSLAYAVRPNVVAKYFGQIALSLAGLTGVPAAVALGYGELGEAWRYGIATAVFVALGLALGRMRATLHIQRNEALVVIALVFLAASLALAWPFTTVGMSWVDSIFEAISAVTTTGLSTQAAPERLPQPFLFARSWGQWYGGLIIVVLALATMTEPGVGARRLAAVQMDPSDVVSGTRAWARRSLAIYCVLTVIAVALIWGAGGDPFVGVVHALSAVSTGGFSSFDASLAGFGTWWTPIAITLAALSGAIAFPLYYRAWQGGADVLWRDAGVRALLTFALAATILLALALALVGGRPWGEAIANAPLVALSAQTTSGFTTLPIAGLDPGSKLVLIATMLIGGDSGSTAGGIKILRVLLVIRIFQLVLLRTVLAPHAVAETHIGGRRVEAAEMQNVLAIVLLYVAVIALSWAPFVAWGFDPLDALFEVVSATGTVGLSTGLTAPTLPTALKMVLCLDMLMGRLEIVAILVLFYPRTWFGSRAEET